MINTSFGLDLEKTNEAGEVENETVKVVLQEISPFVAIDIFTGNLADNGRYKMGAVVKELIGTVIVSPKNLVEKIEECDNPGLAIGTVFKELNRFCNNPKRYVLLQKQSEAAAKSMVDGNTESDTNGSQTA